MSKNFEKMTIEEQAALAQNVANELKNADLSNVKVQLYREAVGKLDTDAIMNKTILKAEKSLPSTKKAQVDRFNEAVKQHIDGVEGVAIKVSSAVNVGDQYQTITNVTTLDDAETPVSIEHKPGTVMMIDFWATWCPPCQRPMAHNQEMLEEHNAKWGDNVQIIGLSIDKDAETVKNHINAKGWTSPIHYHRAKSDCSDVYQVRGVPHVLIVDTTGKIVFKGHPANRKDLVKDFDDLLAGKELEGVEAADAGGDGEDAPSEGFKETDLDGIKEIMNEIDNYATGEVGTNLLKACKADATGMMRNFCVITLEAELSTTSGKWSQKYTNHRVLVGSKEKIDACKDHIQTAMGTGFKFELNEQYHEM